MFCVAQGICSVDTMSFDMTASEARKDDCRTSERLFFFFVTLVTTLNPQCVLKSATCTACLQYCLLPIMTD